MRCAGLVIPTLELLRLKIKRSFILSGALNDRRHEILRCGGFSVMTFEIKTHPPHKALFTQKGSQHANQLSTLFVDRCCVEIVDGLIRIRLHRMSCGPGILTKLGVTEHRCILNAFQRRRMQISREALVAKYGEALLQRQLKPVAAGDPIARPIVEIFMGHHTLNAFEFSIGRRF